jgi:hypothetical protein
VRTDVWRGRPSLRAGAVALVPVVPEPARLAAPLMRLKGATAGIAAYRCGDCVDPAARIARSAYCRMTERQIRRIAGFRGKSPKALRIQGGLTLHH